jgi:hypothetical protein
MLDIINGNNTPSLGQSMDVVDIVLQRGNTSEVF